MYHRPQIPTIPDESLFLFCLAECCLRDKSASLCTCLFGLHCHDVLTAHTLSHLSCLAPNDVSSHVIDINPTAEEVVCVCLTLVFFLTNERRCSFTVYDIGFSCAPACCGSTNYLLPHHKYLIKVLLAKTPFARFASHRLHDLLLCCAVADTMMASSSNYGC